MVRFYPISLFNSNPSLNSPLLLKQNHDHVNCNKPDEIITDFVRSSHLISNDMKITIQFFSLQYVSLKRLFISALFILERKLNCVSCESGTLQGLVLWVQYTTIYMYFHTWSFFFIST